jgi:aerobic-type carbon monoxide dehydrogenase small subunit (CoxS/CutS family)
MRRVTVASTVNGDRVQFEVDPRWTLADALRHKLGLTGTHLACEHGVCGACTVLLDGVDVRSCTILAPQVDGHEVVTVEGVARLGKLHEVQRAFLESHSFQCGFCTPGFVMTAVALLAEGVDVTEDEVRSEISGNICRCSGYQQIIEGVLLAAIRLSERDETLP